MSTKQAISQLWDLYVKLHSAQDSLNINNPGLKCYECERD